MLVARIKNLCKEKKTTITALEREVGLSKGSICKWDVSSPKTDSIVKIATYFDVTVDYLLGLTEDRKNPIPEDEVNREIIERFSKLSPAEAANVSAFIAGLLAAKE